MIAIAAQIRIAMYGLVLAAVVGLGIRWHLAAVHKGESDLRAMQGERDGARSLASACSDATEALRAQAAQRAEEAKKARAAAASAARSHEARADYTLGRKPSKPNACDSLQALGDEWLAGRAKP